jgi:mannose-6-phosphate isomerase-like protein (cupin superfamily)
VGFFHVGRQETAAKVRGMQIVDFAIQDWLQVEEYDIVGTAHAASIASGSGEAHVRVLRLGAGSRVPPHETGFGQLFVPIDGRGWVSQGSDQVDIGVGQAAYFPRGVIHAKGTETGMVALMIQVDDLDLGGEV